MRVLIIYSGEGKLDGVSEKLGAKLRSEGAQVQLMKAEVSGSTPIPCAQYDVICVGSPTQGFIKGKVAGDVVPMLKRCTRLEGRNTVAFVTPRMFATTKALRALMQQLEKQGAMVQDFAELSSEREIERFAERITRITKKG